MKPVSYSDVVEACRNNDNNIRRLASILKVQVDNNDSWYILAVRSAQSINQANKPHTLLTQLAHKIRTKQQVPPSI